MGAVLVVDDNPSVRKCLARCVAVAGPLFFTASDGSEALRLLGRDEIPRRASPLQNVCDGIADIHIIIHQEHEVRSRVRHGPQ